MGVASYVSRVRALGLLAVARTLIETIETARDQSRRLPASTRVPSATITFYSSYGRPARNPLTNSSSPDGSLESESQFLESPGAKKDC